MKRMSLSFIFSFFLLLSCGKKSNPGTEAVVPSNLNVVATVSTDNSGNVSFTATATNVVSYEYDFGNGVFQTVNDGKVTYKYPASGTYNVKVTGKSRTGQTITRSIDVQVNVAFALVWSDEFNTDGAPDPAKWGYDIGTGSNGWGNNELQYYTNRLENASVSNGTLKITAKREAFSGSAFTSARLLTKNKFTTKYGKIEARAKLPTGVGTWPAIWMLGANIDQVGWPACGEIDIMEYKGSDENRIYGTLHYPGRSGGNADGKTTTIQNASTEFHIYAVEWTAASIKISVDGNVFYTFNNNPNFPFNHNFFIILNVAMGGAFGGPVEAGFQQSTMEVDYVRVYN
jgi:beta-glucanase (GH16 family)